MHVPWSQSFKGFSIPIAARCAFWLGILGGIALVQWTVALTQGLGHFAVNYVYTLIGISLDIPRPC